ncbi:MAG TPA: DUF4389 domain-containing protein [Rhizomicrobium sp.]|nr:DUF4389 domain-containing protein [Rhizomicrobium sp.]
MTDSHTIDSNATPQPKPRPTFPAVRFFYAIGYAVLAWIAFWLLLVLSVLQFAVLLFTGRVNPELKGFNLSLLQYLWELFAFITFARDDRPFPFGPFPKPQ